MTEVADLNGAIARRLFGWRWDDTAGLWCDPAGYHHAEPPHYSTDIATAWEVVEYVNTLVFSRRQAFKAALQMVMTERMMRRNGISEAWWLHPDEIILRVQPADICRAALAALGEEGAAE